MAMQSGKSVLAAKVGAKLTQAHAATKGKPVEAGNPQLPAGIEGGVAQLVDAHIGEYKEGPNKGNPFFMAAGIVKRPTEHGGVSIEGQRTQVGPEPLCETPNAGGKRKAFADHYKWMRDQLNLLGFDLDQLAGTPEQIEAGILAGCAALSHAKPHFKFRTWSGSKQELENRGGKWWVGNNGPYASEELAKKANPFVGREPRVQHEWNGRCEFADNGEPTSGVADATPEAEGSPPDDAPSDDVATAADESLDLDALAEAAQGGDNEAGLAIEAAGEALGILGEEGSSDPDTVKGSATWADAVELIKAAQAAVEAPAEEPAAEPEPEVPWAPAKDEVYGWSPPDPKKPGKKGKQQEVIIAAVFSKNKTIHVNSNVTKKPILGEDKKPMSVKWDDLETL